MHIVDRIDLGYLSVRHHVGIDTALALRNVPVLCRQGGSDNGFGVGRDDLGIAGAEMRDTGGKEDTLGQWDCMSLWGVADPSSREDRDMPGYSGAWPSLLASVPSSSSSNDGTPSSGSAARALLVRTARWDPDTRRAAEKVFLPPGWSGPKGWPGIAIAGTEERRQDLLFFPAGGVLCAPYHGGHEPDGSLVYEALDDDSLDKVRKARIQSAWRVYETPKSCAQAVMGPAGGHGLAIQCGTPLKDFPGLGMFADDKAASATTGDGRPPQVLSPLSYRASGPLHPGFGLADIHSLGTNSDGDEASAGGISKDAYFVESPSRTGPLDLAGDYPKDPQRFSIPVAVDWSWDPRPIHNFACGRRQGKWRGWTTTWAYSPPPTRRDPPRTPTGDGPPYAPGTPPQAPGGGGLTSGPTGGSISGGGLESGPNGESIGQVPGQSPGLGPTATPTGLSLPGVGLNPPPPPVPQFPQEPSAPYVPIPGEDQLQPWQKPYGPGPRGGVVTGGIDVDGGDTGPDPQAYQAGNLRYQASWQAFALPELALRPQLFRASVPDLRNQRFPTRDQIAALDKTTPMAARLVVIGAQSGDSWVYTQKPSSSSRYSGGTVASTAWLLPPEVDPVQIFSIRGARVPSSVSNVRLGLTQQGALGFGTPLANGGVGSGFLVSYVNDLSSNFRLDIKATDSAGATVSPTTLSLDQDFQIARAWGNQIVTTKSSSTGQVPVRNGGSGITWTDQSSLATSGMTTGLQAALPEVMAEGAFYLATDTCNLYVGC